MATSVNPGDDGFATSTAGAATINHSGGVITTESLTTAGLAAYTMTLTNNCIQANSIVLVSVGSASAGTPVVGTVVVTAGQAVIKIQNVHATVAFNNTLKIAFLVV